MIRNRRSECIRSPERQHLNRRILIRKRFGCVLWVKVDRPLRSKIRRGESQRQMIRRKRNTRRQSRISQPTRWGQPVPPSVNLFAGFWRGWSAGAWENKQWSQREWPEKANQQRQASRWAKRPAKIRASACNRASQTGENAHVGLPDAEGSSTRDDIRRHRLPASPRSEHRAALPQSQQRSCCSEKPMPRRSTATSLPDTAVWTRRKFRSPTPERLSAAYRRSSSTSYDARPASSSAEPGISVNEFGKRARLAAVPSVVSTHPIWQKTPNTQRPTPNIESQIGVRATSMWS